MSLFRLQASEFKFSLSRSTDWQYVGRRVKYTLEMTIPETTQLKTKIKCPFNTSAILRLTKTEVTEVSSQLTAPNTSPNLTSSANDGLHDIAFFEFGEVTRATYENETKIKIEFEIQVMDHQEIVNGGLQWVSVGTEYKNQSVWAAMLAVKTVKPACKRPDLKVTLWSVSNYHTVRSGYACIFSRNYFKANYSLQVEDCILFGERHQRADARLENPIFTAKRLRCFTEML